MTTGSHEAWAEPDPHRRGWFGRYQTDKGVKTVSGVGEFRRVAILFGTERAAIDAAQKALIAYLVKNPRPRSSSARPWNVTCRGLESVTTA